jgi:CRP/FNR family cyclic AMP-dependent transcriptional regulator
LRSALIVLGLLSDSDVEWIAAVGRRIEIPRQEVRVQEGEPISFVDLLLRGSLTVHTRASGSREIGRISPGELIGELSFLDSRPPSATLRAREDSVSLAVPRDELATKLRWDAEFASRFYRSLGVLLAHRLRRLNRFALTVDTTSLDEESFAPDEDLELDPLVLELSALAGRRLEYLQSRMGA